MDWIKSLFGGKARSLTSGSSSAGPDAQKVYDLVAQYIDGQGGVQEVVKAFEQSGFIGKVRSWVSTGQNAPINSVEVLQLFGPRTLSAMAAQSGISIERLRELLADVLPGVIDRASPSGKL
jgi:uncharacterized protein YidB (DUF937 family)